MGGFYRLSSGETVMGDTLLCAVLVTKTPTQGRFAPLNGAPDFQFACSMGGVARAARHPGDLDQSDRLQVLSGL